jgi:hypothetical protein
MREIGVRDLMGRADGWFMCRVGDLETVRAVGLVGGPSAVRAVQKEWAALSPRVLRNVGRSSVSQRPIDRDALRGVAYTCLLPAFIFLVIRTQIDAVGRRHRRLLRFLRDRSRGHHPEHGLVELRRLAYT